MKGTFHAVTLNVRKLDSSTGSVLRRHMSAAWEGGARVVALDLSELIYIDSLGISALVSEQRKRPEHGKIVLCSLTDYVRDVLEVTQLVRVFDVYATVDAARAAFDEGAG